MVAVVRRYGTSERKLVGGEGSWLSLLSNTTSEVGMTHANYPRDSGKSKCGLKTRSVFNRS